MFDYVKMKATQAQRINVKGVKTDVAKDEIIEVRKTDINFYKAYRFIEIKMEDKIQKKEVKTAIKKKETKKISTKK